MCGMAGEIQDFSIGSKSLHLLPPSLNNKKSLKDYEHMGISP